MASEGVWTQRYAECEDLVPVNLFGTREAAEAALPGQALQLLFFGHGDVSDAKRPARGGAQMRKPTCCCCGGGGGDVRTV
jgi:hypothetical protein